MLFKPEFPPGFDLNRVDMEVFKKNIFTNFLTNWVPFRLNCGAVI